MKKLLMRSLLGSLAVLLIMALFGAETHAQKFDNEANGIVTNNGTVRFTSPDGQLLNETANPISSNLITNSSGTIVFLGDDSGTITQTEGNFGGTNPIGISDGERITGWVVFGATAGNQVAYGVSGGGATYYNNLAMSGAGTKDITDAFHVSQEYENNWTTSGDRTYNGTFFYDGADQDIAYESGNIGGANAYNILDLSGTGTKTVPWENTGGFVHVDDDLIMADNNTALVVYDTMRINRAGGDGEIIVGTIAVGQSAEPGMFVMNGADYTYQANIDVYEGTFLLNGAGSAIFDNNIVVTVNENGTLASADDIAGIIDVDVATLALVDNSTLTQLDIGNNTTFEVSDAFTNDNPARTNMVFGTGSLALYNGADGQTVMTTAASSSYYNLTVEAGGTKGLERAPAGGADDVYVGNDFTLGDGSNNTILRTATGINISDAANYLFMYDGTANYFGTAEVEGGMARLATQTATTYTMHNTQTLVSFQTNSTDFIGFDIRNDNFSDPSTYGANGLNIQPPDNPAETDDVDRKVTLYAPGEDGSMDFMQIAYRPDEYTPKPRGEIMRFLEGDGGDREQKITTGIEDTRDTTSADFHWLAKHGGGGLFNFVEIAAAGNSRPPQIFHSVANGSDIILTNQENYLISIRNGRWTDPLTWDEGRQPYSDEDVEIRTIVYTGIYNSGSQPFGGRDWDVNEEPNGTTVVDDGFGNPILAKHVEVQDKSVAGTDNAALVIGDSDADQPDLVMVFGSQMQSDNGVDVMNSTDQGGIWGENFGSYTNLQGLHVMSPGNGTFPNQRNPEMRARFLENKSGRITNNNLIEVGE